MTELELYNEYLGLARRIKDLEIYVRIWSNEPERLAFEQELEQALITSNDLREQLVGIEDKKYSRDTKQYMVDQLSIYIRELEKKPRYLLLHKGHGLNIDNELFSMMVRDLNYILVEHWRGGHIPYFVLTNSEANSVSLGVFLDFIIAERTRLINMNNQNFILLNEYVDGLIERMREQFIE